MKIFSNKKHSSKLFKVVDGARKSSPMVSKGLGKKQSMKTSIARLPNIIVHQLAKRGILTTSGKVLDKKAFFRWLNDPDNKHFRIYTGNL
jgi:hypothetical protein